MEEKEQSAEVEASATLLDSMYKNVRMGADSILDLIPKVTDEKMRHELVYQLGHYEEFSSKLKNMLSAMGKDISDEGTLARLGTKMSVAINTMIDSTPSHIAEMMIEELKLKGFNPATSLLPLDIFYPESETYHDMYYDKKGTLPSCHPYIEII